MCLIANLQCEFYTTNCQLTYIVLTTLQLNLLTPYHLTYYESSNSNKKTLSFAFDLLKNKQLVECYFQSLLENFVAVQ